MRPRCSRRSDRRCSGELALQAPGPTVELPERGLEFVRAGPNQWTPPRARSRCAKRHACSLPGLGWSDSATGRHSRSARPYLPRRRRGRVRTAKVRSPAPSNAGPPASIGTPRAFRPRRSRRGRDVARLIRQLVRGARRSVTTGLATRCEWIQRAAPQGIAASHTRNSRRRGQTAWR